MLLDSTSDLVRLITSASASIEVHAAWVDWDTGPTFTPGSDNVIITTATTTTVVASPTGTIKRQVKNLIIRNDHASTACDVTVEHTDGTDNVQTYKATLLAGEVMIYDGAKWQPYTALGIPLVVGEFVNPVARLEISASGGGAGANPIKLTAGTLLTTAEDGGIEMDADNFYGTVDAGNRGIIPVMHFIRAASDQTLTSQTAAQNIFDSPANGTLTLETGTYLFDMLIQLSGMSATSGNGQILFGGAGTFADWNWVLNGLDASLTGIADDDAAYFQTNASAASAVTAQVATTLRIWARGSFECSAGGTWIPQIALVTAAAAIVESGSYLTVFRMGAQATTNVGQWT
jgi:hypothetical protein